MHLKDLVLVLEAHRHKLLPEPYVSWQHSDLLRRFPKTGHYNCWHSKIRIGVLEFCYVATEVEGRAAGGGDDRLLLLVLGIRERACSGWTFHCVGVLFGAG